MDKGIKFLYLNEEETIAAGVTDMKKCIETMREVFALLGRGDYVMGGPNRNSHGIKLYFPKEAKFENMPIAGPDRRFMALVAYLGGRFNICGEKWYGSNIKNREKGLPRSILMVMLNDAETGAPIALIAANILSSMRTGAIPGVGAKFLAKKDAKVLGAVGVGVIGKACVYALIESCEKIDEVKIYDINSQTAQKVCEELKEKYHINVKCVNSIAEAVRESDVINIATAGADAPVIEEKWLKDGALLSLPASAFLDKGFMSRTKIVVDNWKMYEAYEEELANMPGGYIENLSGVSGSLLDYVQEGCIKREDVISLSDIVIGKSVGRKNDSEKIIFIMDGMPVEDVAWGYEIYKNALKLNLGVSLKV